MTSIAPDLCYYLFLAVPHHRHDINCILYIYPSCFRFYPIQMTWTVLDLFNYFYLGSTPQGRLQLILNVNNLLAVLLVRGGGGGKGTPMPLHTIMLTACSTLILPYCSCATCIQWMVPVILSPTRIRTPNSCLKSLHMHHTPTACRLLCSQDQWERLTYRKVG